MPEALQRDTVRGTEPPCHYPVLHDISWSTYEALLADTENRPGVRFFYDQGTLEIMTPISPKHETTVWRLLQIIVAIADEWKLPLLSLGHTTMLRDDLQKGFEADASLYLRNASRVEGKDTIDLHNEPAPELVLEVEVSRSALDKLAIYARIGVPEVWRCDGARIAIHILQGNRYIESSTSVALPGLTTDVIAGFLASTSGAQLHHWLLTIREWARAQRPPK